MESIEQIEKRLWASADNLRANSNYASNEYFLPVMGLIFLRHAFSRFELVKAQVEPTLPKRGVKRLDVVCPGFSADCLETLEEMAMGDRDIFLDAGGEQFRYIPCLNDRTDHIEALASIVTQTAGNWLPPA